MYAGWFHFATRAAPRTGDTRRLSKGDVPALEARRLGETSPFILRGAMRKLAKSALFDYNALDEQTRIMVLGHTGAIRQRLGNLTACTVQVGEWLYDVKNALNHGDFGKWLNAEFKMTHRTARRFITAYKFADTVSDLGAHIEDFTPTALYVLGAPSMSNEVIDAVIQLALDGNKITPALIRKVQRDLKPDVIYLPSPTAPANPAEMRNRAVSILNGYVESLPDAAFWQFCRIVLKAAHAQLPVEKDA